MFRQLHISVFFTLLLGSFVSDTEGSPGLFTLLGFKSKIEALHGGGDLLQALVDNLDGVTADQLKQVSKLMPLIDAKHGKPNDGFLLMMSTLDSSTAGHDLLQDTIGMLSDIPRAKTMDINNLVPLMTGNVNASQGATILNKFIMSTTGKELLFKLLGNNSNVPIQRIIPVVSELLQAGSVSGAAERVLTPGGKANGFLMDYIRQLGGDSLVGVVNTVLPVAAPILSLALESSSNETLNYTMNLLQEMNHNLQNVTVQKMLGSSVAKLTTTLMKKALDMIAPFEIYPDLYNLTVSESPLEGLVSLIGNINTTLIQELFGNSSLTEHLTEIVDHAGSVNELWHYAIQSVIGLIRRPSTSELFGALVSKGSMQILTKGFDFLVTLVDNPDELYNVSLFHPLSAVMTILEDLNTTRLEEVLGNSSLVDTVIDVVNHAGSPGELVEYLLQALLHEIEKPSSLEAIGQLVANESVYVLTKLYKSLANYLDNPDDIAKLSISKPFQTIVTVIKDLNATKLKQVLGNSSLATTLTDFIAHADSIEDMTIYFLKALLHKIQKPSVLTTIGQMIANGTSVILRKGLHLLSSVVDDPDDLKTLSLFNPVSTLIAIIDSVNVTKLSHALGNSSIAHDIVTFVSTLKSPTKIIEYLIKVLKRPETLELIGPFFGKQVETLLQTGSALLSSLDDDFDLSNQNFSLETVVETIQSMNMTSLDTTLPNSTLSEHVMSLVSSLQTSSELRSSSVQCAADLDTVFRGVMDLDPWALQMLDATGKPGSSMLKGAVKFYGNYDECLAVSTPLKTEDGSDRDLKGSYCRLAFILPQALLDKTGALDTPMPLPADFVPALEWHLCLPKSCDENTISTVLSVLPLEAVNSSVYKVECTHEQDISDDAGALVALAILGITVFLSVIGTLYDVITGELHRLRQRYGADEDDKFIGPAITAYDSNNTSAKTKSSNGIAMVAINGVKVDNSELPDSDSISTSTQPYEADDPEEDYDGICRRLLLAFSFSRNSDKIFNTTKRQGSLECIHGIRVLSMAWIILGHIIIYTKGVTDANATEVLKQIKDFTMQAVVNATLAVDTFFLIGGCLVAYLFIQDTVKTGKLTGKQMAMYYVHRFLRLWPLYLIILMTYTCLFKYMMDGPLRTDGIAYDNIHCQSNWWTNVLYINNVYKTDEGCMRWTWFMASDMQFYIIAPLALIPVVLGLPAIGIIVMVLLFIIQIATYAYKEYSVDGSMLKNVEQFEREIYFAPWCRVGVFAMGLLLGYILNKTKQKVHIPRFGLVIGWQISLTIGLVCTYITWNEWKLGHINWNRDTRLVHETLSRPGWGLFVSWIIFVCCTGHGGIVNRLLSWSAWIPLGRLTYGAYLIHPILITYTDFSKRALVYVDFIFISYQFIGTFVLSYALSYLFSVLVEVPCMALEKIALGRFRRQH